MDLLVRVGSLHHQPSALILAAAARILAATCSKSASV